MLKCGVIGVGYMGKHHTRVLSSIENIELVGISDLEEKKGKKIAKEYSCDFFSNYQELLKKTNCIFIATPTNTHRDIAIKALKAKNHIFIEKPISLDINEAEEIIKTAKKSNLLLQIGHIERFNPAVLAAKKFIEKPLFFEAHRLSPFFGRGTDVSVVLDLMVHDLDIILNTIKSPVKTISAAGVPVLTDNIDIANARIEFENGAIANVTASRISQTKVRKIRFWQKNSYVSVDSLNKKVNVFYKQLKNGKQEIKKEEVHVSSEEPLFLQNKAFLDACSGEKPLLVKPEEAKNALALAQNILEKIKKRAKKVNLKLFPKNEQ
jgi:predicted dehydrogenase